MTRLREAEYKRRDRLWLIASRQAALWAFAYCIRRPTPASAPVRLPLTKRFLACRGELKRGLDLRGDLVQQDEPSGRTGQVFVTDLISTLTLLQMLIDW